MYTTHGLCMMHAWTIQCGTHQPLNSQCHTHIQPWLCVPHTLSVMSGLPHTLPIASHAPRHRASPATSHMPCPLRPTCPACCVPHAPPILSHTYDMSTHPDTSPGPLVLDHHPRTCPRSPSMPPRIPNTTHNQIYLLDKMFSIFGYTLSLTIGSYSLLGEEPGNCHRGHCILPSGFFFECFTSKLAKSGIGRGPA